MDNLSVQTINAALVLEPLRNFDAALKVVQEPLIVPFNPNKAETIWLLQEKTICIVAAYWVVRNRLGLWSKRKSPFNTLLFKIYESWGQLLTDLLALCIACHDEATLNLPYDNGFEHWMLCVQEIRYCGLLHILRPDCDSKREYERLYKKDLRMLRQFENPYLVDKYNNLNTLFDAAILLAEGSFKVRTGFYNRYYLPYLTSHHAFITDLKDADLMLLNKKKDETTGQEVTTLRVKQGPGRGSLKVHVQQIPRLVPVTLIP